MPSNAIELRGGIVIRLGAETPSPEFYANGYTPDRADFHLSKCDEAKAAEGKHAGFSVWDVSQTSPEEANAFLDKRKSRVVFEMDVHLVRSEHNLRVPFEAVEEKKAHYPGAAGHAAIVNVWDDAKARRKLIQGHLVHVAFQRRERARIVRLEDTVYLECGSKAAPEP